MTAFEIAALVAAGAATSVLAVAAGLIAQTCRIARWAERMVPPAGGFVDVAGARIHYVERGEGRPVVFLHGLGGHLSHMSRPLFGLFGPGYRLIALDRPGSGYSRAAPRWKARLSEHAAVVAGFVDALGLERPLLVGHSFGGAVALATALQHPDKVAGLALVAPLTHAEKELRPEFHGLFIRSPLKRRLLAWTLAVPASLKRAPATLRFIFGPQMPPADYAVAGGGLAGLRPSHIYATASDLVALESELARFEARYREIGVPVGILFGTADRVLAPSEHGAGMAGRVARLEMEFLEGIGHMPQYAEPERVIAFIRRIAERAFGEPQPRRATPEKRR